MQTNVLWVPFANQAMITSLYEAGVSALALAAIYETTETVVVLIVVRERRRRAIAKFGLEPA